LQGFGIFVFLWQFLIPLIVFVVAYWKILGVVRRQAQVSAHRQPIPTVSNSQKPVAGTSEVKTEMTNDASTKDMNQRDRKVNNGATTAGLKERGQIGDQTSTKTVSKAQVNVVKTMVYITVCFTLCWMPLYFTVLFKKVAVRQIKSLVTVTLLSYKLVMSPSVFV